MTATFTLPARLDLSVTGTLSRDLLAHHGSPLNIDAGMVSFLGTPGLQVLIAAARDWAENEQPLTIRDPSAQFLKQLERFGVSLDVLQHVPESADTSISKKPELDTTT